MYFLLASIYFYLLGKLNYAYVATFFFIWTSLSSWLLPLNLIKTQASGRYKQ